MNIRSTVLFKILAIALAAALSAALLLTIIQSQADTLCTCAVLCSETETDADCSVCAENFNACTYGKICTCTILCTETDSNTECPFCLYDWTICDYKDTETPDICICNFRCSDLEVNPDCSFCMADYISCNSEETLPPAVCECTAICSETIPNPDCHICMGDYKNCAYKEVCNCTAICTETIPNPDCPICMGDYKNCAYKSPSVPDIDAPKGCSCILLCSDTEINTECTICKEDYALCAFMEVEIPVLCNCINLCSTTSVNEECPICKDGFSLCSYKVPPLDQLLALCESLSLWYDGVLIIPESVDAKGRLLNEIDKVKFYKDYEEIVALEYKLSQTDPTIPEKLAENENYKKINDLYRAMNNYTVQYFSNDGKSKMRSFRSLPETIMPNAVPPELGKLGLVQECDPDAVYTYPTREQAGIGARRGFNLAGWSNSPLGVEPVYAPGESYTNLANTPGATINLFATWAEVPTYTVNLTGANVSGDGENFGVAKATAGEEWKGRLLLEGYHLNPTDPLKVTIGTRLIAAGSGEYEVVNIK